MSVGSALAWLATACFMPFAAAVANKLSQLLGGGKFDPRIQTFGAYFGVVLAIFMFVRGWDAVTTLASAARNMSRGAKGFCLGLAVGMVLVVLNAQANYQTYLYVDKSDIDISTAYLTIFAILFVLVLFGFVHFGLVHNRRDGLAGICLGVLASCPLLFIGLAYSAHLATVARHAAHHL